MMAGMSREPGAGRVSGGITISAPVLREALIEEFVRENRAVAVALRGGEYGDEEVAQAMASSERARAVGELLDHVGWVAGEEETAVALRFGEYDWAAAAALRAVIDREHRVAVRWNAVNDREEAQAASARRAAAILALEMLMEACEREGRDIANPPPRPRRATFDPRMD
jgi:hypothetical protein